MKMNRKPKGLQSRKKYAAGGGVGSEAPLQQQGGGRRGRFMVDRDVLRRLISSSGLDPGMLARINSRFFGNVMGAGAPLGFQNPSVAPARQASKAPLATRAGKEGGRVKKTGIQSRGHTRGKFI